MPTPYTGVSTATQAPDTAPEPEKAPNLNLPNDGEALNVSSIYQALKVLADHVHFSLKKRAKASSWVQTIERWRTAFGHTRFTVDHLGFPGGKVIQWHEHWLKNITHEPGGAVAYQNQAHHDGWFSEINATTGTPGVVTFEASGDSLLARFISIACGSTTNDHSLLTRLGVCQFNADNHAVLEFDVRVTNAALNASYVVGLATNWPGGIDPGVTTGYAWMTKTAVSPNWFCETKGGGAGTVNDSSVAVPSATWQRVRIEWHGANVSDDGTARCIFYINGTLVQNITTNLPIGDASKQVMPFAFVKSAGQFAEMRLRNVRFSANLYALDVAF